MMPENVAPSAVVPLKVIPSLTTVPFGMKTPPPRRSAIGCAAVVGEPFVTGMVVPVAALCWMLRPTLNRRTLPPVKFAVGNVKFIVQDCVVDGDGAVFAKVATT